jgi:hypothetical protein
LGRVGWVKWVGSDMLDSRIGSGTDYDGLDGSGIARVFFQIFLHAPVLDPSVLTDHGSDGFEHGSGWDRSRPRVGRIGYDRVGFF